jgi:vancomycin aglycone glucosyltransferase
VQSADESAAVDRIARRCPATPTAESLTAALERVLQPEVAPRAQTIARAVRLDGAEVAAARLVR